MFVVRAKHSRSTMASIASSCGRRYGGLGPSEVRRLKQLEEENAKLKRLVADLSLDKAMLQDVLSKTL